MTQEPRLKHPILLKYTPKPEHMLEADSDHADAILVKEIRNTGVTVILSVHPIIDQEGEQYLIRENYNGYNIYTLGGRDVAIYKIVEFLATYGKPTRTYFDDVSLRQEVESILHEALDEELKKAKSKGKTLTPEAESILEILDAISPW